MLITLLLIESVPQTENHNEVISGSHTDAQKCDTGTELHPKRRGSHSLVGGYQCFTGISVTTVYRGTNQSTTA
jgi:hypothetical protein